MLARNSAVAKKRGRGGNFYPVGSSSATPSGHFPHTPFSSHAGPSGKVFYSAVPLKAGAIKIRNPDFRQKRFGFCPKGTAMKKLTLSILPEKLGICHFEKNSPIPDWATRGEFFSITRTDQELSIVYPQEKIPAGVLFKKDWRAFRLEGFVDGIYAVGIIASLSKPLAELCISIFNISTYETNYILLEEKNLEKAKKILGKFCEIKV